MKTETFNLGNLCCVSCADDVERALRSAPTIKSASVDYQHNAAMVTYQDDAISPAQIATLISQAGHGCTQVAPSMFAKSSMSAAEVRGAATLTANGSMEHAHDGHANRSVEQGSPASGHMNMAQLEHQTQMAPISMGTKMDRMQYEMPATAAQHVHQELRKSAQDHTAMGHGGHMGMDHDMSDPKMARAMELDMRNRFFVALLLTIPTLLYSPLFTQFFGVRLPAPVDPNWIMFVLSTPVVWWSGWIFISGAYQSLKHRALNMSVLIATGVLAAYLFSVLILFVGGESFFEAAAMLVTFVLFGHWMEMRARRGTNDSLRALFDLVPPQARVVRDGQEIMVPTSEVVVGDTVVLRPGEGAGGRRSAERGNHDR